MNNYQWLIDQYPNVLKLVGYEDAPAIDQVNMIHNYISIMGDGDDYNKDIPDMKAD